MRPLTFLLLLCFQIFSGNLFSQIDCSFDVADVLCYGDDAGMINLTVTNGQPGYTFAWTGPGGFSSSTQNLTGLAPGTYIVTVTDANNETCTNQITINEPDELVASIESTALDCSISSLTGSGIGGILPYVYEWYDPSGVVIETSQTVVPQAEGTYTLDLSDNAGCNDIVTFDYMPSLNICDTIYIGLDFENVGDQVRVDVSFQNFEAITSYDIPIRYDQSFLQFDEAGLFNLDGLSAAGFNLVEPGLIRATWSDQSAQGVTLEDGFVTFSLFFTPLLVAETEVIVFSNSSEFTRIAAGEVVGSSAYLIVLPDPEAVCLEATVTNACLNSSDGAIDLTPSFGTPGYSFNWSNGQTTSNISGLAEGLYTVTVTDANNEVCIKTFTIGEQTEDSCDNNICTNGGTYIWDANTCSCVLDVVTVFGCTNPAFNNFDQSANCDDGSCSNCFPNGCTDPDACNYDPLATCDDGFCLYTSCDTFYIEMVQNIEGNQIRVDFVVYDFVDIKSVRYIFSFDNTMLQFNYGSNVNSELTNLANAQILNPPPALTGVIFDWENNTPGTATLQDGSVLFSVFFTPLVFESSELQPLQTAQPQAFNGSGEEVAIVSDPITILFEGNLLSGYIYHDDNLNCENNGETTLANWVLNISDGVAVWIVVTDDEGYYEVPLPDGTYEIDVLPINENWEICNNNVVINFDEHTSQDFGAVALLDCSVMEVDLAIPILRRCFSNEIHVQYCNYGTITAEDAYIDIELDPLMSLVLTGNTPQPVSNNGNTYTYDLGDVALGECGSFFINVILDPECNESILGQTHCVTGTAYPNDPCEIDPLWSGASLDITGSCDGEFAYFVIENIGAGDMDQVSSFIVTEDQVMGQAIPEDFMLGAGESITITKPANGTTYFMIVNQVPFHPGNSIPSVAVEGCGVDDNGEFSLGMVTLFNQGDGDGFEDIECVQNIGSYDPNDKQATIKGFGDENFIYANEQMEYLIRFQNTGTDTAFTVVIEDELSPNYEITTMRPGVSSHSYTYSIKDERTMVFTFENILLPDSTTNLEGSNGFISYKVDQLLDHPDGTLLENTAAIFFDFNEPIITNTTSHTIGSDFVMTATIDHPELGIKNAISVYPNPSDDIVTFELENTSEDLELQIYDITGKLILEKEFATEKIILSKNEMTEGMYFYSILTKGQQLTSGKFVLL